MRLHRCSRAIASSARVIAEQRIDADYLGLLASRVGLSVNLVTSGRELVMTSKPADTAWLRKLGGSLRTRRKRNREPRGSAGRLAAAAGADRRADRDRRDDAKRPRLSRAQRLDGLLRSGRSVHDHGDDRGGAVSDALPDPTDQVVDRTCRRAVAALCRTPRSAPRRRAGFTRGLVRGDDVGAAVAFGPVGTGAQERTAEQPRAAAPVCADASAARTGRGRQRRRHRRIDSRTRAARDRCLSRLAARSGRAAAGASLPILRCRRVRSGSLATPTASPFSSTPAIARRSCRRPIT